MKKFFGEFKKFITRGNVLDMSVGVIVGGAFSAIVGALTNNVLQPIINWLLKLILGTNSLSEVYTFLVKVEVDGVVDLANSIYINWGAFITAIINFILIALVLFIIVRTINKINERNAAVKEKIAKAKFTKEQKKELKAAGISRFDRDAAKKYFDDKAAKEAADAAAAAEAQRIADEEAAKLDRLNNPTTEDLLKQIKALLEANLNK